MSLRPRVVLGLPAYDRPDTLPRTLDSLLSQSFRDFALVIVDDSNSPDTAAIVERYSRDDSRITYEANPRRLGMVRNWRRVFERGRQLYPEADYFAWVSDHDLWSARWLREMVSVLDGDRDVVLAYCESLQMRLNLVKNDTKRFETGGMRDPAERLRTSARYMLAGDMIYGLMRADALQAAGVFHRVLVPDRQVLLALSLLGQVRQVPEILWYREFVRAFSLDRQREAFFPEGSPLYVRLPWYIQHAATLCWDFAVLGRARPAVGRLAAVRYAAIQLRASLLRDIAAPRSGWLRTLIGEAR